MARGAAIYTNDFSTGLGGVTAFGAGVLDSGSFRLTPEANDQQGTLVLPELGSLAGFALSFEYQFSKAEPTGDFPADGMSVSIGPRPGGLVSDAGLAGTPRVLFDIYNGGGPVNGVIRYIQPNGAVGQSNATALSRDKAANGGDRNVFRAVRIDFTADGTLTVRYKGAIVLGPIATGYTVQPGDTITFGSRTGGLNAEQRIDNIGLITQPVGVADIGATEALSGPVNAVVTSNLDSGPGTLRDILAAVPTGSTITFDPAVFTGATTTTNTIALFTSQFGTAFTLDKAVTIDATAIPGGVKLDGGSRNFRFFQINNGANLTLHGLTLAKGGGADFDLDGGAISNLGTLALTRCTLSGNRADNIGNSPSAGAILNGGTATLTHCTLSGNSAIGNGGAINSINNGTLALTHCTLFGNVTTNGFGGGIFNSFVLTTLTHCTLSGNTAPAGQGSGVASFGNANTETVVQNCIISGNTNSNVDFVSGATNTFRSLGGNLIGTGNATGDFNVAGDIINNTPLLAGLGDNGGPTQTMALLANSPARNAAAVLAPAITTDQRGVPIAGLPDIGAYEFPNTPPAAENFSTDATTGDQTTIDVAGSDEDGIPPFITSANPGAGITVNSFNGLSLTFTPAADYAGIASIEYTVSDGNGGSNTGILTVNIMDNDAPEISGTFSPRMVFAGTMPDFRSQAVATDNVGTPTVTQFPLPGSATTVGNRTVTLTATDTNGNATGTNFRVVVRPPNPVNTVLRASGSAAPGAGVFPGLPADAKLASFGPPATSDTGDVGFVAKWTSATGPVKRGTGLFFNTFCLAIVGGDAPIAGAKYASFSDPVVDDGKIAVIAKLTGTPRPPASVVLSDVNTFGTLEVIAQVGGAATTGSATFKAFKSVAIHARKVAIFAQLTAGSGTPKTTAANDLGLWIENGFGIKLALREGQVVGGKTIKTLVSFLPGASSPGQGRGWLGSDGDPEVHALAFFTDKTQGVVLRNLDENTASILSLSGTTTDGAPDITNAAFATYGLPARNDASATTFAATMRVDATSGVTKADARGIFLNPARAGKFTPLARLGQSAGVNSAAFSKFSDPVLSPDSSVAFLATLKGGTAKGLLAKTLWWKPAGQPLALFAQGGTATVGDLPGAQWKSFTSVAITDRGPLFAATLVPGKGGVTAKTASGIWACDFTGTPRALFRTGDTINGKKLAKFTLLKVTVGNAGVTRSFNNTAQVVWLAAFSDKSTAIITTEVP